MSAPTPTLPAQNDLYAVFCGVIDQQSTQRILSAIANATGPTRNVGAFHLLFQSSGGGVAEGVCLYNFFRSLSLELVLYNVGMISSVAVIAYLGAKKRRTSARASFMIHRTYVSTQFAKAAQLKALTDGVGIDDARTESILREHIKAADWEALDNRDLFFTGQKAVEIGLADEVAEFAPPIGTQFYTI